ncbi:MAG: ATP-binding protein [Kofleriaceae bacterium]
MARMIRCSFVRFMDAAVRAKRAMLGHERSIAERQPRYFGNRGWMRRRNQPKRIGWRKSPQPWSLQLDRTGMTVDAVFEATTAMITTTLRLRLKELRGEGIDEELRVALHTQREALAALPVDAHRAETELKKRFQLSQSELTALWLFVTIASVPEARQLTSLIGENRPDPTFEVVQQLIFGRSTSEGFAALGPQCALRRFELIERSDGGDHRVHESRQTWTVSRRVLAWLHGMTELDAELGRFVREPDHVDVDHLAMHPKSIEEAKRAVSAEHALVVAVGNVGAGRRSLLVATAGERPIDLLEVDCKQLSTESGELARQIRMVVRECVLRDRAPLLVNIDGLVTDKDQSRLDLVAKELGAIKRTVFATCRAERSFGRWTRPTIAIQVRPPSSTQRAALWRRLISNATESDGEYLASQYPIAAALIVRVASAATARACGGEVSSDDILDSMRAVLDDRLGELAKRVEITQTWDDFVIAEEQKAPVMELLARIRQRRTVYESWGFANKLGKGLGIGALFSGPPGTGKTMVAGLIAKELQLELFQVDSSKMVSKYIGETEKQLAELFEAAEASNAILLFDEADSMFGKRTDVKSSNDRYANLETNYLLQRLESFTGICLLTTNHESHIDPAFQRRLSLHLRFALPTIQEREHLWHAIVPDHAPLAEDVDFHDLATRFDMSGGYIRNAVLRAAFLAADRGGTIDAEILNYSAMLEYEGMGKITPDWPPKLVSSL